MTIDRILLFPYYLSLKLRDSFYRKRSGKLFTPEVPSVCVGNVTAGGTGKTPHVEMILRMLLESPEWKDRNIAVLSRGYMRESKGFQQVVEDGSAALFGDEPVQIKKKFPKVTVAVDKNRVEGCTLLCEPSKLSAKRYSKCWDKDFPAADYIVLDDAFQYRKLRPALSVVLVDWNRPVSHDSLLPLGRLRDLKERLFDADVLIVTKCPPDLDDNARAAFVLSQGFSSYDAASCRAVREDGGVQTVLFSSISYAQIHGVYPETEPRYVYAKKAILVSGIAKDAPLRNYLSDFYKIVKRFSFSDHHKYSWSDINAVKSALRKNPTAAIITTEKDVQRLLDFGGMPPEIRQRLLVAPIEAKFLSEGERNMFCEMIAGLKAIRS